MYRRVNVKGFYVLLYMIPFLFEGQLGTIAWVLSLLGRYFHYLKKPHYYMFTVWCRNAHSGCQRTEAFLYVIGKSNYMLTYRHLLLCLTFKGNTTVYYIQIVELLINKGANSYKLKNSKIGNRTLNPIAFTLLV